MKQAYYIYLLIWFLVINSLQCKRGSWSRGSSSGHKSSSWGWGSSSKSNSRSSTNSGSGKHSYPSSQSGLSGSAPKTHIYPPASSSLSGFGSHSYPSSSGLSGSGKPSYPFSSTGLSGAGAFAYPSLNVGHESNSHNYPSSTGLSGSAKANYPFSITGLSGSGSGTNSFLPVSNYGSTSNGHNYPSSATGLSGSGRQTHSSSITGLSGFGSNLNNGGTSIGHNYPISTGLSGSLKPNYPSSVTGISGSASGTSSSHKYPSSVTGLSGFKQNYPSSSSGSYGSNYYTGSMYTGSGSAAKPSSALSGYGSMKYPSSPSNGMVNNYGPTHTGNIYNSYGGYHSYHNQGSHSYGHSNGLPIYSLPTYYTAPQYVYVKEYRNSGSRFGDLLTGLALYNMGRSHANHQGYYYSDEYYKRRYYGSQNSYKSDYIPKEDALCTLRIKQDGKTELLKIPCEIVSTFTEGSHQSSHDAVNETVCATNLTVGNNNTGYNGPNVNTTLPLSYLALETTTSSTIFNYSLTSTESNAENETTNSISTSPVNNSSENEFPVTTASTLLPDVKITSVNNSLDNLLSGTNTSTPLGSFFNVSRIGLPRQNISDAQSTSNILVNNTTNTTNITTNIDNNILNISKTLLNSTISGNFTETTPKTINSVNNHTVVNVTTCTFTVNTTDPMKVKKQFEPDFSNAECVVEIRTKDRYITNKVDCKTLIEYSKMPEPKNESKFMPSRSKLKSWLQNPPWWLSIFIAV